MKIGISLPVRELKDDLGAIKAFAETADELGFTHLRVPDQVLRPDNGHLHEPMMLLAYIAALTNHIELVPSVIVTPARQTVLLAKQAAELDRLTGGRMRFGVGVGVSKAEYDFLGQDFGTRGARLEEQIELLRQLWSRPTVDFTGRWDSVTDAGLNPLPSRHIPIWVGPGRMPTASIRQRIGRQADGWFVLCAPTEYEQVQDDIHKAALEAGRDPANIGAEAAVAVVGTSELEWSGQVRKWEQAGVSHLCLRTLGGNLSAHEHIAKMQQVFALLE